MTKLSENGVHHCDISAENRDSWNRFVADSETAGFYHQFEWQEINQTEFGHRTWYLASLNNGAIEGVFPLVLIESRIFGRILCSMPFVNYGGPSATNSPANDALVARACEIAREQNADFLEIRGLNVCEESLPRSEHKVSMTISLASDPDEVWNSYKSKHRTNIRRVYKDGVTVQSGGMDLLDTFYDIMSRSWRSLGTPIYRKQYFRSIIEALGDQVRIYVASQNGQPVATAFNGQFDGTVEGMWAGMDPDFRKVQVNYVLYWEMIKDACEAGFRDYHLGRSTADSGSEVFKQKWGAEARQLYWQYYLPKGGDLPGLNPDNPKFALAIKVWRKLPLWVTQQAGPLLARSIP